MFFTLFYTQNGGKVKVKKLRIYCNYVVFYKKLFPKDKCCVILNKEGGDAMSYETDRYNLERIAGHSLAVTECGIQICHSGHATPKIDYRDYSVHFILEGKGCFSVNGKTYDLSSGQGFIITPGASCVYAADKQKPWKYVYVSFRGADGEALVHAAGLSEIDVTFDFPLDDDTVRDIYAMHSAGKRDEAKGYEVLGYLLLVMSRLVKANTKSKPQLSPPERYVKKVKQYIEDNYSLSITVSDVAFNAGLDRTYLYRLFMKHVGMSPQHYLSDYRLKRAAQMLEDRARPIGEISASAGFRDTSYFYKVFTHKFKKTPKKYREDLAKSDTAHNGEK